MDTLDLGILCIMQDEHIEKLKKFIKEMEELEDRESLLMAQLSTFVESGRGVGRGDRNSLLNLIHEYKRGSLSEFRLNDKPGRKKWAEQFLADLLYFKEMGSYPTREGIP